MPVTPSRATRTRIHLHCNLATLLALDPSVMCHVSSQVGGYACEWVCFFMSVLVCARAYTCVCLCVRVMCVCVCARVCTSVSAHGLPLLSPRGRSAAPAPPGAPRKPSSSGPSSSLHPHSTSIPSASRCTVQLVMAQSPAPTLHCLNCDILRLTAT